MAFITAGNAAPEGRIQLAPHRIFTSLVKMDKYEILDHLFKQNADLENLLHKREDLFFP